jgi:hypothetical protein
MKKSVTIDANTLGLLLVAATRHEVFGEHETTDPRRVLRAIADHAGHVPQRHRRTIRRTLRDGLAEPGEQWPESLGDMAATLRTVEQHAA